MFVLSDHQAEAEYMYASARHRTLVERKPVRALACSTPVAKYAKDAVGTRVERHGGRAGIENAGQTRTIGRPAVGA